MSFSIAATPESLRLQQRHPLDNSKNSSDSSAVGSEAEDTLMAFAVNGYISDAIKAVLRRIQSNTFYVLSTKEAD